MLVSLGITVSIFISWSIVWKCHRHEVKYSDRFLTFNSHLYKTKAKLKVRTRSDILQKIAAGLSWWANSHTLHTKALLFDSTADNWALIRQCPHNKCSPMVPTLCNKAPSKILGKVALLWKEFGIFTAARNFFFTQDLSQYRNHQPRLVSQ